VPANTGNKPDCNECGLPFMPNIMTAGGRETCALCLQVRSQIKKDWDTDFLTKMNKPYDDLLDGPRYG
jgi:hypothetical protein